MHDHLPIMLILLQDNQTPLHKATSHNHLEIVEFLTLKGADVNIRDIVSACISNIRYFIITLYHKLCLLYVILILYVAIT